MNINLGVQNNHYKAQSAVKFTPKHSDFADFSKALASETAATAPASAASPPNTSLRWYDNCRNVCIDEMQARMSGALMITVGKNELLGLMNDIERALANGECFTTALQRLYNSHNHERGVGCIYDTFFINPNTGEIKHALPFGFVVCHTNGNLHSKQSDDAVWDLAYDLQKFLQLRVFGDTSGLSSDDVEKAVAEIKARQSDKCYARFDGTDGKSPFCIQEWLANNGGGLLGTMITPKLQTLPPLETEVKSIGSADTPSVFVKSDEEMSDRPDHIVEFIQHIGDHQDKLHEEYMRLKEQSQYQYKNVNGEIDLVHITEVKS